MDIVISDSGKGIELNGKYGDFPDSWINNQYLITEHEGISVFSTVESRDQISFCLETNSVKKELMEHGRGLLSILKLASQVKYVYSRKSYNYLFIRIES